MQDRNFGMFRGQRSIGNGLSGEPRICVRFVFLKSYAFWKAQRLKELGLELSEACKFFGLEKLL